VKGKVLESAINKKADRTLLYLSLDLLIVNSAVTISKGCEKYL